MCFLQDAESRLAHGPGVLRLQQPMGIILWQKRRGRSSISERGQPHQEGLGRPEKPIKVSIRLSQDSAHVAGTPQLQQPMGISPWRIQRGLS